MPKPNRTTPPSFRGIPAVNDLVAAAVLAPWHDRVPRSLIVAAAQRVLAGHRAALERADHDAPAASLDDLAERVAAQLELDERPPLAPLINATGIIIHTGLGRAPLAGSAARAMHDVATGYAPVELDLATGERGRRSDVVRRLLCDLTGADAATVVNNNAAALMLALAAIAKGRTVVVSRGELIEIGGSFRLPDVIATGGAILREVGTTNKTRIRDYEQAVDDTTAALLKVHPSNYRVEGFTEEVTIEELAGLGQRTELPVIHDVGSGALVDVARYGVSDEPDVRASIAAGADVVLFSGDKLLGGPQAGILVGKRHWIGRIERHPLMRTLRVDKTVLAALGATLQLHRDPDQAAREVPVLALLTTPRADLEARGRKLVDQLRAIDGVEHAELHESEAYLGGGSLPTHAVPSVAIEVRAAGMSESELATGLRAAQPAVVPRTQGAAVWLDLRTVFAHQDESLIEAVRTATTIADAGRPKA